MNIFVLDLDPHTCATYHANIHVPKMIVETAQLLSTMYPSIRYYKHTHYNHPCAKWVRESAGNFSWLLCLGMGLCNEYTFRYKRKHKTEEVLTDMLDNLPNIAMFPSTSMTPFAMAMPDEFRDPSDVVKSYRNYYKHKGTLMKMVWGPKRLIPDWYKS